MATPSSTVLNELMNVTETSVEPRLWSIAILLVLQASLAEIDYDRGRLHSITILAPLGIPMPVSLEHH
jgi:hypothetical protein